MTETIDIRIELTGAQTLSGSQWLEELGSTLQKRLDLPYNSEIISSPDRTMDGGITIAIAIASLGLSALSTALAVVKFYADQTQRGSITFEGDSYRWTKERLTDEEMRNIIRKIESRKLKSVTIKIGSGN